MQYLIAVSGPVASGKSALTGEIVKRFKTHRISTRLLLADTGAPNERNALIEAGKQLDRDTDGAWVRDGSRPYIKQNDTTCDIILIDAVRTERQIHHLREEELCGNLGDAARSGGVVYRRFEDLDAVFESDTCDNLRQVICAFQPPPGF